MSTPAGTLELEVAPAGSRRSPGGRPSVKRLVWVVVALVAFATVAPASGAVYGSLGLALTGGTALVLLAAACEAFGFWSTWKLQLLMLGGGRLRDVALPHLAGNALSNVVPAGGGAGLVAQLRLLRDRGVAPAEAATMLAASGILSALTALLVFPLLLMTPLGASVGASANAPLLGLAALFVGVAVAAGLLALDGPVLAATRVVAACARRLPGCSAPVDLDVRVLRQRDTVRTVLGRRPGTVFVLSLGRTLGDVTALYLAILAGGVHASPALLVGAYLAANAAGAIPFTPGGFGFVEAGLAGALVLGGLGQPEALVAVATYRVASCWLPVLAGAVAYGAIRWSAASKVATPATSPVAGAVADPVALGVDVEVEVAPAA